MTWEYSVQVSAQLQTSPPSILLSWPQDEATLPDFYTVSRKGPTEPAWGFVAQLPGAATNYLDTNISVGAPYEYQLYKSTSNHVGYGYITSGIRLPRTENRGKIILLVDQTFAEGLSPELTRLQQDLVGDGWFVLRHDIPPSAAVPDVKAIVQADYSADPLNVNALFLFGRIPVPYSGDAAPDGHPVDHTGAWPADVFYGVMDGVWTDISVTDTSALYPRNWNVPGDGRYDQSEIPGTVRLEIGRVDFHNMPGIDTNGIATFPSELELLRRYLNKDHNYRQKLTSLPARGLVFNAVGDRQGEAFADDAWRNWAPLWGSDSTTEVYNNQFLPVLQTNGYQWSYATSGSDQEEMSSLGGTGPWYQSGTILDFVRMDVQTEFTMLMGSWFGDWDFPDDLMRAFLVTPTYGLACVYAGRPHWFFHPLGAGETLGYCARLTQNNHANGLYRNQSNNFAGFVHIALLGDPTLRLYTLSPPTALQARALLNGNLLVWSPSIDPVDGYDLYRARDSAGPFQRVNPDTLTKTSFIDTNAPAEPCTYMVRALKLQTTASGSFSNQSQGAFVTVSDQPVPSFSGGPANPTLSWHGFPGRVYSVMWTASLSSPNWLPMGADLLATNPALTWSLSAAQAGSGWVITNTSSSTAKTFLWVDDALPNGAVPNPQGGEDWKWVSTNPVPYSGLFASQSINLPGMHQHYFDYAGSSMTVNAGDLLIAAVYLAPGSVPSEIMLQWKDDSSWEHRAFWGSDLISVGTAGTPSRMSIGTLPAPGQWSLLQVPASVVGLEGSTLTGMSFTEFDGQATWDYAGKFSPAKTNSFPSILTSGFSPQAPQRFYKIVLKR